MKNCYTSFAAGPSEQSVPKYISLRKLGNEFKNFMVYFGTTITLNNFDVR